MLTIRDMIRQANADGYVNDILVKKIHRQTFLFK